MKRKNLILFGVLFAGLAALFLAFQAKGTLANNLTFEERLNIPPAQAGNDLLTPTAIVIPEGSTPTPSGQEGDGYVSREQVIKNEAILESANTLIEKANTTYRVPGWWHSVYQIYLIPPDPESNQQPNGLPMPPE